MRAETPESTGDNISVAILTWLEVNKKRLAYALLAVVIVAAVVIVYRNHKADVEQSANKSLLTLTALSGQGVEPTADQLKQKSTELAGTRAGERAMLLLGVKLYEDGKYPEAQTAFEQQIAAYPDSPLVAQATLGIASSLDAQNKTNEALTAYERFVTGFASSGLAGQAKMAQARLQESMHHFKEALAIYNEITSSKDAVEAQEARALGAEIMVEHPELAPPPKSMTNTVRVVAPPTGATNGALRLAPTPPAGAPGGK